MKDYIKFFILLLIIAGSLLSHASAQLTKPTEYEVKAAFIYNFAKFVEWPTDDSTTINLCILGDAPFGTAIESIQGKTVGEKNMSVTHIKSYQQSKNCQILFISNSEKDRISRILDALKNSNTLTIGDTEGFAQQGLIFNFYIEQDKVRFEINLDSANRSGLRISSKLLKLGKIVKEKS